MLRGIRLRLNFRGALASAQQLAVDAHRINITRIVRRSAFFLFRIFRLGVDGLTVFQKNTLEIVCAACARDCRA